VVVLGQTFASARGSSLDLASAKANNKVSDESVFRLTAAMADHGAPSCGKCKKSGFDAFGHRAYLIHFKKQRVAGFSVDASLDACGVGDEQIIADLQHEE
jgi:hypothetical protein